MAGTASAAPTACARCAAPAPSRLPSFAFDRGCDHRLYHSGDTTCVDAGVRGADVAFLPINAAQPLELLDGAEPARCGQFPDDVVLRALVIRSGAIYRGGGRPPRQVIFENAYLVKTSTGFAPSGATIEDLKLMREHSPAYVQVKAAGGVRTLDALLEVMAVGVTRVGATATETILEDFKAHKADLATAGTA